MQVQDVATALKMYSEVSGSFVGGFFPEWPTVDQIDESGFTLNTEHPVPVLDYLMTNILITPAADNRPEELQSGVGSGPYIVTASNRGTGNYTLEMSPPGSNCCNFGRTPTAESICTTASMMSVSATNSPVSQMILRLRSRTPSASSSLRARAGS